jgi:DNA-binding NarL/FixJ family response regulator
MACPARDPETPFPRHQNAIEEMVQEGHTDNKIVAELARSERSLQRHL